MIAKTQVGVVREMRRDVAGGHDGNRSQVLVIVKETKTAPDQREYEHKEKKQQQPARLKDSAARLFY